MPLPRRLARFNKRVTNPVARLVAGWMPVLAIVTHTGRVSAHHYRTPVNIFRSGDRYVFALTYGAGTDWVTNVLAAGRCSVRTRRKEVSLVGPEVVVDPARRLVPAPARWILGLVDVDEFLAMAVARPGEDHRYAADHGSSPTTPGAERQAPGIETTAEGRFEGRPSGTESR
jgi:deazaflavin-dependent oxidoreductase (nitroreductase family)